MDGALDLIDHLLCRAPEQELVLRDRNHYGSPRSLKRYVGIDAEFMRRSLNKEQLDLLYESQPEDIKANDPNLMVNMQRSNGEQFLSVLTFCIDRHVVFTFFVLEMMEKAEQKTVEALTRLLRMVIFNPNLIKLWFK